LFGPKACIAAPKARNIKARGKREAKRRASPLVTGDQTYSSPERAKLPVCIFRAYRP
jgi:hypothetical protein